jgi:hypothetical protein
MYLLPLLDCAAAMFETEPATLEVLVAEMLSPLVGQGQAYLSPGSVSSM